MQMPRHFHDLQMQIDAKGLQDENKDKRYCRNILDGNFCGNSCFCEEIFEVKMVRNRYACEINYDRNHTIQNVVHSP